MLNATLPIFMLSVWLCCVYLVDIILKKDIENPFYSSNSLLLVVFFIYNTSTTKCHNQWPDSLMWYEAKFLPAATYKHMG